MTSRALLIVAAALGLSEYLAISFLFDARELVPPFFEGIGGLAPLPAVVAAAMLVLRASAAHGNKRTLAGAISVRRAAVLASAQLAAFGAFLATSFAVRAEPSLMRTAAWTLLAGITAASLLLLALGAAELRGLARKLAGPLGVGIVVGALAWAAGRGTGELWHPLARATIAPIGLLMRALFSDAVVLPSELVVGTERFSVFIEPVCSGYEGMGLVSVLVGAYLWTFRATLRFPHALMLPPLAALLAFCANLFRIAALISIGTLGAPDIAMGGFHSKAGWLLFCAVALGTVALARRARFLAKDSAAPGDTDVENPSAAYLLPLIVFTAASLVVGLVSDGGLNRFEWIAAGAALAACIAYRRDVRDAWTRAPDARPSGDLRWGALAGVFVGALWLAIVPEAPERDAAVEAARAAMGEARFMVWVGTRLCVSIAIVPVVEELAFRGFLLRRLVDVEFHRVSYRDVTPLAVVASSLVFGLLHDAVWAGICAGVVLALASWVTHGLRAAVVAHAVANAMLAASAILGQRWSLWT